MKKFTLFFAFFAFTAIANAQVLLDEIFSDFPTTDVTTTVNGWTNWSGNTMEPNLTDTRILDAAGLVYADINGITALSGKGASLHNNYVGVSGTKTPPGTCLITYKPFIEAPLTTGAVYTSFLFQPIQQGGSQGQTVSLSDSIHRSAMSLWVRQGASASVFKFGITRSSGGSADIVNATPDFTYGVTYFIVMKYDFASLTAYLYVNPVIGGTEPASAEAMDNGTFNPSSTAIARTKMQYLMLINKGSNKSYYYVSGMRVCTSWSDAVAAAPLPKVSTPTIQPAGAVGIESFTANWTPTSDANGYTILVYNGTNLFTKFEVAEKTASSAEVTGLVSNSTYTYQVQAKGDNSTTSNSDPSAISSSFTTMDGALNLAPNFSDGNWGTVYASSAEEPLTGSFPSFSSPDGFTVTKGLCSGGTKTEPDGSKLTNSIKLDKGSTGANISFPSMKQVQRVEIHAWTGTASRPFLLQELLPTGSWSTGETFTTDTVANSDQIFISTQIHPNGTKLRIMNSGGGALNIGVIKVDAFYSGITDNYVKQTLYSFGETITSSQSGTLTLYNLQGVQVYKGLIENKLNVNVQTGLYVARLITTTGKQLNQKIIIK